MTNPPLLLSRVVVVPVLLTGAIALTALAPQVFAGPRPPKRDPAIILAMPDGQERLIEVTDLSFAFFERSFYQRSTPKSENLQRQRVDIEDRREECHCLRLEDWTKIKFREMQQIEIRYPPDGHFANLRITHRNGTILEMPAERLHGAGGPIPPRFSATVDGIVREYRLVLPDPDHDRWPEERLVRILLRRPPETRRR